MMTEESPFYLTPGNKTQQCWFRKSAMGINKLYSIMTEMKTDAGIQEPRITPYRSKPHIIYTTFITRLKYIIKITYLPFIK